MTNESHEQGNQTSESEIIDQTTAPEESVTVDAVEESNLDKVTELELALASAKATIDDQKDSVIRARAEMENIRRRSALDVEKAHKFALEKFAGELLPVIDNLERAMQSIDKENESLKPIYEGIELTLQSFLSSVDKFGVKVVDPQDQPFNPEYHQAMAMQDVPGVAPNTVIAVMQKGYELNGRLLRPAMVMVSNTAPTVDTSA